MNYPRMKRLMYGISFLNSLVFYAPVALLVRTQMGITLSQFFTLQIILSASILLFEVPAGYLSDRMGYKTTMVISQTMLLVARLLLLTARSYPMFAIQAVVEGLNCALSSGTESAYLYSYCQGEEYAQLNSRISRVGSVGFLLSTLSYSVILTLTSVSGLVAAACIPTFFSLLLTLMLPKERSVIPESQQERGKVHLPRQSWPFFLILSAVSMGYLIFNFFIAVKVERMGLPYESLTWIILGYSLVELLAPAIIKRIRAAAYTKAVAYLLALCAAFFGGIFLLDNLWCALLLVTVTLPMNIISTLTDELLNEHVDRHGLDEYRATVLSMFSMIRSLLEMAFLALSAVLAENEGNVAFLFIAVYLAVTAAVSLLHWRRNVQDSPCVESDSP